MTITLKASIAQVQVGNLSLEGLLSEEGIYGVGYPQLVSHNLVPRDRSIKELEAKLRIELKTTKWRITSAKAPVNVVLLADFEKLLAKLDRAGNKAAQDMRDDLVGLSLTQLFSDAFGTKFEKEERQQYLIDRQSHREDYRPKWCDWLKRDGCIDNQYGTELNNLKRHLKLPLATINTYDAPQLRKLDIAYIEYNALRSTGMTHIAAISRISH